MYHDNYNTKATSWERSVVPLINDSAPSTFSVPLPSVVANDAIHSEGSSPRSGKTPPEIAISNENYTG